MLAAERKELARRYQMPGAKIGTQVPGKLVQDAFTYTHPLVKIPCTASAVGSAFLTIEQDADFAILQRSAVVWTDGGLIASCAFDNWASQAVTVQLTDVGSGRVLCDPVYLSDYAGSAQVPHGLGQIKRFAAMQSLRLDYRLQTAIGGSSYLYVQLAFIGRKLFCEV